MIETNLPTTPRTRSGGCPRHSSTPFGSNHPVPRTTRGSSRSTSRTPSKHARDSVPPCHRGRAEHATDAGEDLDEDLARLTEQIRNLEKRAEKATLEARVRELEELTSSLSNPKASRRRPAVDKKAPNTQPESPTSANHATDSCWICGSMTHHKRDCQQKKAPNKRKTKPCPIPIEDLYRHPKHPKLHASTSSPELSRDTAPFYYDPSSAYAEARRADVAAKIVLERHATARNLYVPRRPIPPTQRRTIDASYIALDRKRRRNPPPSPFLHPNHPLLNPPPHGHLY